MKRMNWMTGLVAIVTVGMTGLARAQYGGHGQNGDAADRAVQARQLVLAGIRQQIGAEDVEWRILQPKVEAVLMAQNEVRSLAALMATEIDGQQPLSAVEKAARELMAAMQNTQTPTQQVAYKLTVYRETRAAARKRLEAAQQELGELVTVRQEVALMALGLLD